MNHDPLTLALGAISLLTSCGMWFDRFVNKGKKEGVSESTIEAMRTEQSNAKAEREMIKTALGAHTTYIAKQEVINDAQGQVNRIREERENEIMQRVSRCEAQVGVSRK